MFERLLRMDKYVILTLLLVGEGKAIHYFRPDIRSGSWDEALQECSRYNSSLAIIRNEGEQKALFQYLQRQSMNRFAWTAGKKSVNSNWTWINGQPYRFNEGISIPEYQTAAILNQQLEYEARDPSDSAHYICQFKPNDTKCTQENDKRRRLKNGCVKPISGNYVNWLEARNDCLRNGGYLPVLDGIDLDNLNQSRLWWKNVDSLWLGLRKIRKISWMWYSNNKGSSDYIKYTNWYHDHPYLSGSDCIAIDRRDGKWSPVTCARRYEFVCENRATSTDITETLTSGSTITTFQPTSDLATETTSDLASQTNPQVTPINHFSEFKVYAWLGIAVAFIIICIIIVIFAIRKHNKSSKNTRQSSTELELRSPANPLGDSTHGVYAEIPLVDKSSTKDTEADNVHRGIYYASFEFENSDKKSNLSPAKRTYPQGDEYAEAAIGKAEDDPVGVYANYNPSGSHPENPNHSQQHHPTGAIYINL